MSQFFGAEVNSSEVVDMLDKIVSLGGSTGPAMQSIARFMENEVRLGFRQSRSPYGEPWDPIQHRTGKPLVDKGTLRGSITSAHGPDFAEVGTNMVYGPIHQFGGYAGRNRATKIGARPYLPIQGDEVVLPAYWEEEILGILEQTLTGILS